MILALVVTLVPPLALTAVELVASLIWPPLGRALHVAFVGRARGGRGRSAS